MTAIPPVDLNPLGAPGHFQPGFIQRKARFFGYHGSPGANGDVVAQRLLLAVRVESAPMSGELRIGGLESRLASILTNIKRDSSMPSAARRMPFGLR